MSSICHCATHCSNTCEPACCPEWQKCNCWCHRAKRKEQVIHRFCALASRVQSDKFGHKVAADCFCDENKLSKNDGNFQFEDQVLEFIETAVLRALQK